MPSPAFSLALSGVSLVALTLVSGCGNRGDLYLESELDPALVEDLGAIGAGAPDIDPIAPVDEDDPDAVRRSRRGEARSDDARSVDEGDDGGAVTVDDTER